MAFSHTRCQRSYDHRLRDLVRTVGNPEIVAEFGVPRSTALGWLRGDYGPVVTANILDMDHTRLQVEHGETVLSLLTKVLNHDLSGVVCHSQIIEYLPHITGKPFSGGRNTIFAYGFN